MKIEKPVNRSVQVSSSEAEEAVLGAVLINPIAIERVEGFLTTGEVFYYKTNREIWETMLQLRKERVPVDIVSVISKYKDKYGYSGTKDIGYILTGLAEKCPSSSNAEVYARIIVEKHIQKKVAESAHQLSEMSYTSYESLEQHLNRHVGVISELQNIQPTRYVPIDIIIDNTLEHIKSGDDVISYGIKALDAPAGGMTRKEITVLGGRPGHGKSSLILNIASSLVKLGNKVMIFNREMTNISSTQRLIVSESEMLEYNNVRRGRFSESEAKDLLVTSEKIKGLYKENLLMFDDIRDLPGAMREIRRHRPDVVIDDYIQLIGMHDAGLEGRRFEIEHIMNEYKWIAKELNLSALLVSQLSREIEKRFIDQSPRMSDYSEGGTIEQLAECCLFVLYPYNFDHGEYDKFESQIISAKTRYGKLGTFNVGFSGARCKFYNTKEEARIDTREKTK